LEQRLDDLADTVCTNDPRRRGELRAAALATLGVVGPSLQRLTCMCGASDCPGSGKDPRAGAVTIYALAEQIPAARQDTPQQGTPATAATPETAPNEPAARERADQPAASGGEGGEGEEGGGEDEGEETAPAAKATPSPAIMLDGTIIPTHLLTELIATGATVRPLADIADLATERQYRPSTKLTAFVRMRSMTCSFPGCSKAAHTCDLDHLVPWPAGPTHPGNLAPLCRLHHLIKTFAGWTPDAHPDGTITWTAPTGHRYAKTPGAAILFPYWNITTPIPRKRAISLIDNGDRNTCMPTRTRTRAQDRAQRIKAERQRNEIQRALESADYEANPPPF
jgi:hypothetical protein